jgi:hypothetical protein
MRKCLHLSVHEEHPTWCSHEGREVKWTQFCLQLFGWIVIGFDSIATAFSSISRNDVSNQKGIRAKNKLLLWWRTMKAHSFDGSINELFITVGDKWLRMQNANSTRLHLSNEAAFGIRMPNREMRIVRMIDRDKKIQTDLNISEGRSSTPSRSSLIWLNCD